MTPSIVCFTWIGWQTFTSFWEVSVVTVAFIPGVEVFTRCVLATQARVVTIVNFVTLIKSVTIIVFFTNAIVPNRPVDTGRMFVTLKCAQFALVDWTDERIVISRQPAFPLRLVNGSAEFENVIEECPNASEKVVDVGNAMEVDERTWNCARLNRTLSAISDDLFEMRCCFTIFLEKYVNFCTT